MEYWIGVTDDAWFKDLADLKPDEVNFWQPSSQDFRAIDPGAPFLFKLHSPRNYIVGGGLFVRHTLLPLSLAWTVFGSKNGASDLESFRKRLLKYCRNPAAQEHSPVIGCIVLTSPFFFQRVGEHVVDPQHIMR